MYEEFYGLREKPFNLTPDPEYLFLARSHQDALNHLLYGISQREGFIVITGRIGLGKTTLCRALLERVERKVRSALILNPILSDLELLRAILIEFQAIAPRTASRKDVTRKDLIDRLNEFLLKVAPLGEHAVLLIDEAQNLSLSVLEQLRLLSNLETNKEKLLQIILVGQPEFTQKLAQPELAQLNQRVSIRYHMEPLLEAEVEHYIAHRLRVAGSQGAITFAKPALKLLYRYTQGVPRLINLICDRALLAGFEAGSTVITDTMVKTGHASLGLASPVRPRASWVNLAIILCLLGVIVLLAYDNPTVARVLTAFLRLWK